MLDMGQPVESFGNYDLIKRIKLDFTDVVVAKWKSRVTGLTVIHLDYEGLLYSGGLRPANMNYSTNCKWILRCCN